MSVDLGWRCVSCFITKKNTSSLMKLQNYLLSLYTESVYYKEKIAQITKN